MCTGAPTCSCARAQPRRARPPRAPHQERRAAPALPLAPHPRCPCSCQDFTGEWRGSGPPRPCPAAPVGKLSPLPSTPRHLSPVPASPAQRPIHTLSRLLGLALAQGGQPAVGPGPLDPERLGEGHGCRPALSFQSCDQSRESSDHPTRLVLARAVRGRPSARRDTHGGTGGLPASLYLGLQQEAWGSRLSASPQPWRAAPGPFQQDGGHCPLRPQHSLQTEKIMGDPGLPQEVSAPTSGPPTALEPLAAPPPGTRAPGPKLT